MTQAFNLGQLANNLNTSGQLDATDGLVGAVPIANGGTGATTAATARTNLDVAQAVYSVPQGGIIIWSGPSATIPTGWLLCNGTSGTPNLINRFILGAAAAATNPIVGASGGSHDAIVVSHTHTFTGTAHSHTFSNQNFSTGFVSGGSSPPTMMDPATGTTSSVTAGGTNSTEGTSGVNANMPLYYALCYIMKS